MLYTQRHGIRAALVAFSSARNRHPVIQFVKYGVCGVIAALLHQLIFGVLGYTLTPHFDSMSTGLSMTQRTLNFVVASTIGFLISNSFCYLLNIKFVFEPGRRRPIVAFGMFTLFASIGYLVGLIMAVSAFNSGSAGSWGASLILIIASVIVNYFFRKFVVFKQLPS